MAAAAQPDIVPRVRCRRDVIQEGRTTTTRLFPPPAAGRGTCLDNYCEQEIRGGMCERWK